MEDKNTIPLKGSPMWDDTKSESVTKTVTGTNNCVVIVKKKGPFVTTNLRLTFHERKMHDVIKAIMGVI